MPQLPRVAVVGDDPSAVTARAVLTDAGLHTVAVMDPVAQVHGIGPFEVRSGSDLLGRFDAVVITEACRGWVATTHPGDSAGASARPRFGGVFDPGGDGVYLIGTPPAPAERTSASDTAQSRWLGEYLRGRYLLPARSVMLAQPELASGATVAGVTGVTARLRRQRADRYHERRYLERLDAEVRRGRARAAAARYPLPVPSRVGEVYGSQTPPDS